jgi:hypothetical protein
LPLHSVASALPSWGSWEGQKSNAEMPVGRP